jgi:6-phosphogluconolactonase
MFLYTGCYTEPSGNGTGVGVHRFDPETGEITTVTGAEGVPSPTFLALGPNGDALYAVAEGGTPGGSVVAYRRDPQSGELTELNRQSTEGGGPCHVSIDASGRYVLVANYGSGSIAALPIQKDGSLGEATGAVQHEGASQADPSRQDGPHAHQIVPSPDGQFIFVNDLGLDRVFGYRLDLESGALEEVPGAGTSTAAGAGPRHLAFSPDGGTVYVINELDSTLGAYSYDAATGALTERVTVSTLPADFNGESYCAHVLVSPDGRFVYGSNRGHDSIAIFAVGEGDTELTLLETFGTGVTWPRNFTLTPDGAWMLIGNERADSIIAVRRDAATGLLSEPVTTTPTGSPVCLVLVEE